MSITVQDEPIFRQSVRKSAKPGDPITKGYYDFCASETWAPCVNLYETSTSYIVCVDLAGVEKEKIDVVVTNQNLKLRGHRNVPTPEVGHDEEPGRPRMRVHLMEIDHGSFSRDVELPEDVEKDAINANYRNGMLWIELPKSSRP